MLSVPQSVTVIGATARVESVGRTIFSNLIQRLFEGTVFSVNLQRHSVLGTKTYPSIGTTPEPVNLVIVVVPAAMVSDAITACVDVGVKGAMIISAGCKETGALRAALEQQLEQAQRGNLKIIGSNGLGVMCPPTGLNATFAGGMARPGNVGFISQCVLQAYGLLVMAACTAQSEDAAMQCAEAIEYPIVLINRLLQVSRDENLESIRAAILILPINAAMQRVCEKPGFRLQPTADTSVIWAEKVM